MNDDFNTPILIAEIFSAVKYINQIKDGTNTIDTESLKLLTKTLDAFVFDILGLQKTSTESSSDKCRYCSTSNFDENKLDHKKTFALSDQIRDQLAEIGIQLKDGKDGTTFSVE